MAADQGEQAEWSCFGGIYCINLDRRPERWEFMEEQFDRLRLPARRWAAVDGNDVDLRALVEGGELHSDALSRFMMPDDQKLFGVDLTPGALGCALSHHDIWIDIMRRKGRGEFPGNDRDTVFLVVEDDCRFLPNFDEDTFRSRLAEVPPDWQVLFLGGVDAGGMQELLQISPGVRRVYNGSRETTAYAINVEGVRAALEVCFPLMWQLDTQMTLQGVGCDFEPEIRFTTKPMSYIFWPPLVEQNKEDFATDVQKDEHPRFLHGPDGEHRYEVALTPVPSLAAFMRDGGGAGRRPRRAVDRAGQAPMEHWVLLAGAESFQLVGSWDDWQDFAEFVPSSNEEELPVAEVQIPKGLKTVQFQLVRNQNWDQRIYPAPTGHIILGETKDAHGHNWKLQVVEERPLLHMYWDPISTAALRWRFYESPEAAMARPYALIGSWDAWSEAVSFVRVPRGGARALYAQVKIPAGVEVTFQIACSADLVDFLYPSPAGDAVVGPCTDCAHKNWKVAAQPVRSLLRVRLNPVAERSVACSVQSLE